MKKDPIANAFLWIGISALIGLIVSGVPAFVLAAPAGVMIGRLLKGAKASNISANLEPEQTSLHELTYTIIRKTSINS